MDDTGFYSYRAAKKRIGKEPKSMFRVCKSSQKSDGRAVTRRILWSDESKVNLKGSDGKRTKRRSVDKRLKQVYTIGTVKHESGKGLMV